MTANLIATIWLVLAIGYHSQIGGTPRECTGRGNIQHAAVLRAFKPNGDPWLFLCEDLQSWMAYPWETTRNKLARTMAQPWFIGADPNKPNAARIQKSSILEIRQTFKHTN